MNQVLDAWNENDKHTYLSALSYVLTAGDTKSEQRREFMKNKAREVKIPLAQIKKVRAPEDLIAMLAKIHSIKVKRFIVRDMILMTLADHDLTDSEMHNIYDICAAVGIKSEKVDDFFLWAARGLEWQVDGNRLVEEDI